MQSLNNTVLDLTELKLQRLKDLKSNIKVLQAEYDMICDELKEGWFKDNEEFKTSRGLVLASYKEYTERRFDQKWFDSENPGFVDLYKKESVVRKFLLK